MNVCESAHDRAFVHVCVCMSMCMSVAACMDRSKIIKMVVSHSSIFCNLHKQCVHVNVCITCI